MDGKPRTPDSPTESDEKVIALRETSLIQDVDEEYLNDPAAARALLWKLDLRVLPIFMLLWFLTFIDRVNIANAKIQGMEKGLHMSGNNYNVALTVFFATFIAFEVPLNMLLGARIKWLPPKVLLGGQVLLIGFFAMGQGLVNNFGGIVAMRLFVGLFEAGLVPGTVTLLSNYYPRYHLQWRMSILAVANALASSFGGLLAYAIIGMDGKGGRKSWRWVFIIEGAVTAVAAVLGLLLIVDWPEKQKFLSDRELKLARHLIAKDCHKFAKMDTLNRDSIIRCVTDWKIWLNVVIYIGTVATTYSINLFGPTIIQGLDPKYTPKKILLLTAPIFLVSAVFCLASAWISDRLKHRSGIVMTGYLISTVGFGILLQPKGAVTPGTRYMAIYFVAIGSYISLPILWTLLANNVSGVYKTAFASSVQIGLGSAGGIVASFAYQVKDAPLYHKGHTIIFSLLMVALASVLAFCVGIFFEKKKRAEGKRDYRLASKHVDNMGDDHPHFKLTY
ncbi:MFS transporter [Tricladium varicosporioides]|nr:MFS transporter [Hymenoscyphus varicosporioides]